MMRKYDSECLTHSCLPLFVLPIWQCAGLRATWPEQAGTQTPTTKLLCCVPGCVGVIKVGVGLSSVIRWGPDWFSNFVRTVLVSLNRARAFVQILSWLCPPRGANCCGEPGRSLAPQLISSNSTLLVRWLLCWGGYICLRTCRGLMSSAVLVVNPHWPTDFISA